MFARISRSSKHEDDESCNLILRLNRLLSKSHLHTHFQMTVDSQASSSLLSPPRFPDEPGKRSGHGAPRGAQGGVPVGRSGRGCGGGVPMGSQFGNQLVQRGLHFIHSSYTIFLFYIFAFILINQVSAFAIEGVFLPILAIFGVVGSSSLNSVNEVFRKFSEDSEYLGRIRNFYICLANTSSNTDLCLLCLVSPHFSILALLKNNAHIDPKWTEV